MTWDTTREAPIPRTPNLRLKDMEMDGVDAEVLYGMTNAGMRIKDLDLANDHLSDI